MNETFNYLRANGIYTLEDLESRVKMCIRDRPMPRKDLMNRSDAEIVSTFNSEIRGLYNFYRIAENVGALHKLSLIHICPISA